MFVDRYILYLLTPLICCIFGIATAQTISVDNTSRNSTPTKKS